MCKPVVEAMKQSACGVDFRSAGRSVEGGRGGSGARFDETRYQNGVVHLAVFAPALFSRRRGRGFLKAIFLIAQLERFDATFHDLGDLVIDFWNVDSTRELNLPA